MCNASAQPIAGDGKYGGRAAFADGLESRLMLHAREIALPHPDDGTTLRVSAPLPPHMKIAWQSLGFIESKAERAERDLLDYADGIAHSPPGTIPRPKKAARKPAKKSRRKP